MKKLLHCVLLTLAATFSSYAYDFAVANADGKTIYYDITSSTEKTVSITYNDSYYKPYSGDVIIPELVTYNSKTYTVTEIAYNAFDGCTSLTSVTIPNSVTSIGSSAFYGCSSLTSVSIPSSVKKIGDFAFEGCSGLKELTIPNSVTSIGYNAFKDCRGLKEVSIGDGVTSIGDYAFSSCSGLKELTIPNSVTSIDDHAFSGCSGLIKSAYPSSINNPFSYGKAIEYPSEGFIYENGVIYDKDKSTIYYVPLSQSGDFVIPNSVTSIVDGAFYGCNKLVSLTIGNSVRSIEREAFSGCSGLKSLVIGSGVLSVGSSAFADCSNLYKVILLPNTLPSGMNNALNDLTERITYVANDSYTGIPRLGTIKKYDFLSSYFEVNGVRYVPVSPVERTCAAIDCTYDPEIENITIGETVSYKGVSLNVIELNPKTLFRNETLKTLEISAKAFIGDNFAAYAINLESVTLNEKISSIGDSCFYNCTKLKSINIPASITKIPQSAFYNCSSLSKIELPNALESIECDAFHGAGLYSITIPSSTTSIADGAFYHCTWLTKFVALDGSSELSIGYSGYSGINMFAGSWLREVVIGRNLKYNTGSYYGYSPFYRNSYIEKVTFTDIPTEVFTNEFYYCRGLKEVSIGDGVTSIGDYAFSGCSALKTFSFGTNVKTIGAEAFSDCTAMTSLYAEPTTPPSCRNQALDDINKWECTLYVPESSINKYRNARQWEEFFFIESVKTSCSVEDISALIDCIIGGTDNPSYDIDGDGYLTVGDISALIDRILTE